MSVSLPDGDPWAFDELGLMGELASNLDLGLFIDVGANIGRFSRAFLDWGWSVVAFEPVPDLADELRANLSGARVRVVEKAVLDYEGEVELFISQEHWGIHSIARFHETHLDTVQVEATRLDKQIELNEVVEPLFLKIDTEGADFLALRGWSFEIALPKLVVCEFMDSRSEAYFGYNKADMVDFMATRGYLAYVSEWSPVLEYSRRGVAPDNPPVHLGVYKWPIAHEPSWGNLFFVRSADETWFEKRLQSYSTGVKRRASRIIRHGASLTGVVEHLEQSLANRERRIEALLATAGRLERRAEELTAAVSGRDRRIDDLEDSIQKRGDRIGKLDSAVAQQGARVEELDAAILQRDARIGELDAAILQRNTLISELEAAIVER